MNRLCAACMLAAFACAPRSRPASDVRTDGPAPSGALEPLHLFVGSSDGKIRVFVVDTDSGELSFKHAAEAGTNPSFLAFDPQRRRVVATDESDPGLVRSFEFDPCPGSLTEVSAKPAGGAGTTHVSLDPEGRWVFAANYLGGTTSILPLVPRGALGDATDMQPTGAMTHWAGTSPSGRYVFVASLGADRIAQYELNRETGALTSNGSVALPPNTGPRHLAFHPSGRWAYSINELAVTVTTFAFDEHTGKLTAKQTISALPAEKALADATGAEIAVHPTGKHVYASTRGYDSIAQFTVHETSGTLTLAANVETGGHAPRSFGLSPEGTLLFAGNQSDGNVVAFRIDPATGALQPLGQKAQVPSPTFVGVARMPKSTITCESTASR